MTRDLVRQEHLEEPMRDSRFQSYPMIEVTHVRDTKEVPLATVKVSQGLELIILETLHPVLESHVKRCWNVLCMVVVAAKHSFREDRVDGCVFGETHVVAELLF